MLIVIVMMIKILVIFKNVFEFLEMRIFLGGSFFFYLLFLKCIGYLVYLNV